MQNDVVEASIKGIMPTNNGCAIFLGPEDKTFIIFVDQLIGNAIKKALDETSDPRPMTHDLIGNILSGLGAELDRIVISDCDEKTFYARIIVHMDNEVNTKIVEFDARPSDSMVLALQRKKPILVAKKVLDAHPDVTEELKNILKQQQ